MPGNAFVAPISTPSARRGTRTTSARAVVAYMQYQRAEMDKQEGQNTTGVGRGRHVCRECRRVRQATTKQNKTKHSSGKEHRRSCGTNTA